MICEVCLLVCVRALCGCADLLGLRCALCRRVCTNEPFDSFQPAANWLPARRIDLMECRLKGLLPNYIRFYWELLFAAHTHEAAAKINWRWEPARKSCTSKWQINRLVQCQPEGLPRENGSRRGNIILWNSPSWNSDPST